MLEPETRERMREFFLDKQCTECDSPAERYVYNKFWCMGCLSKRERCRHTDHSVVVVRVVRDPHLNRRSVRR